jgi:hypothetical protein
MNHPRIIVYIENQTFRSPLETSAAKQSVDPYFATQGEHLTQLITSFVPIMMVVDMTGRETSWLYRYVSEITYDNPKFPIVAIAPAGEEAIVRRLESTGCKAILTNRDFEEKIEGIIERVVNLQL